MPTTGLTLPERTLAAGEFYRFDHGKRGRALIFNEQTFDPHMKAPFRSGSESDAKNMSQRLAELDFSVTVYHNQSAEEILGLITKVAKLDHSDMDCFACVILTHGENNGVLYARDKKINLEDLLAPFKGDKCPTLAGKPKLFFLQACRGDKLDDGMLVTDSGHGEDETDAVQSYRRIPTEADFLLAFSVIPGYFSWRNSQRGSWFIQALSEMLERYGRSLDLLSILTRVSHKVAYEFESNANVESMSRKKQIPCVMSMLTKDVFFPPKARAQ